MKAGWGMNNMVTKERPMKEIFLAVVGTTPQVLTECLFYYTHPYYEQNRYFSSIKILTTSAGRDSLKAALFGENKLSELEQELAVTSGYFQLTMQDVIVFHDENGYEMADLLKTEDNQQARAQTSEVVKALTEDPDVRLTATVAGGRKTMGALMALSFQLYGRKQDELIHIIPHEEKMNDPSWFFPAKSEVQKQELMVSHVPVIRVGRYLSQDLNLSVDDLMKRVQDSLIDLSPIQFLKIAKNTFQVNDGPCFSLQPREAALFRFLLRQRSISDCEDDCMGCPACSFSNIELFEAFGTGILRELNIINGKMNPKTEKTAERWNDLESNRLKYDSETLNKKKSDLISEIKSRLFTEILALDLPQRRKAELLPANSHTRPILVHSGIGRGAIIFSD
jgi:CRISPR-associated protein (TIGR02584 family)